MLVNLLAPGCDQNQVRSQQGGLTLVSIELLPWDREKTNGQLFHLVAGISGIVHKNRHSFTHSVVAQVTDHLVFKRSKSKAGVGTRFRHCEVLSAHPRHLLPLCDQNQLGEDFKLPVVSPGLGDSHCSKVRNCRFPTSLLDLTLPSIEAIESQ
jgi:hypothetical protein